MNVNTDKTEITWHLQMLSPEELRPKNLLPKTQLVRLEIISTHSLGLAKEICNRGLVLDAGGLVFDGEIGDGISRYKEIVAMDRSTKLV